MAWNNRRTQEETMQELHVVAGIVWKDGRFLAARRPEGKRFAGFWEFPGGKIETDESPEAALVREFREEMAITPREWSFWQHVRHEYCELTVNLYFYHITVFDGAVVPLEGHEVGWFTHDEAMRMPFLEADIAIVDALKTYSGAAPDRGDA